ncbi:MAG: aspartate carbamoyltransferase [Coxiella sp. RIFCSPHIGHO2_12_FULL_44_14]|nr:MAG: aspartate carbamoyltransferase [Coxiella sp. RIFCSPHIGHO2_12_FULL_44_14]
MTHKTQPLLSHLLDISSLGYQSLRELLSRAEHFVSKIATNNYMIDTLNGKIVTNLFFEPSTRTRNSFAIAAHRLGAILIDPDLPHSSLTKGESLLDTVRAFEAMGTSVFIIRHKENDIPAWVAQQLRSHAAVVNAGDGTHQHPTQALIDLLTIQQHKPNWTALVVAIVGDILHSRVANSLIDALTLMNVAQIRLLGPAHLLPETPATSRVTMGHSLQEGLRDVDVVMSLRLQKERMPPDMAPEVQAFHDQFGLTPEALAWAKPDAIVMHPGPMNRAVEITSAVADGPQSVIWQQVRNGVAVRMAVLERAGGASVSHLS